MIQKMLKKSFFLILGLIISFASMAQQTNTPQEPVPTATPQPLIVPTPPDIDAKAYLLIDANSGKVLAEKNSDQKLPPASLTKIMTLYLISQALQNKSINLSDQVPISEKAWRMGGSKMFIKVGDKIPVEDLLQGIIVASGNDSCVAMSEFIAGSENSFISMMNTQAKTLGMNNTNYTDCTGMPNPNHYTTARDLGTLAMALIKNFPQDYSRYKQKWFVYNNIRQPNRNRLLWRYPYTDGIKTGHTDEAGFCLVSSALKDGMRLIAVVLNAPTDEARANDSISLLTYGFRFFESHLIYQAGSVIAKPRVFFGNMKNIPAGVEEDLYATIPTGQYANIKVTVNIQDSLKAPIKKGQTIGAINVMLDNNLITSVPLVALADVTKGGIFSRTIDHIAHLFSGKSDADNKPQAVVTTKASS